MYSFVYTLIDNKEKIMNCEGIGKHGGEREVKKCCGYNCSCMNLKKKFFKRWRQVFENSKYRGAILEF